MAQALAFHVDRDPGRPAITCGTKTLTRVELDRNSNRRARGLQALGVVPGDFVAITLPNGLEFFETSYAIWKLGATPAPLSPRLPLIELQALVDLLQPRIIVGAGGAMVEGHRQTPAGDDWWISLSAAALPDIVAPSLKAMTSGGSTGRPKVIVDAAPGAIDPLAPFAGVEIEDTVLIPGPLYHASPFGVAHMALSWGGHVVQMERFDAVEALRLMEAHKVRYVNFVPTMMHRIWRAREQGAAFDDSSLEMVMHVAAVCPLWLKQKWIEWLGPERVWEFYGGTEGFGATSITGREWLEHPGSVGRVALGGEMKIFADDGRECEPGEVGCIYFTSARGLNASYRYVGTESQALGEWETYGDLGHVDADGYLYISDRRTDMIVCGGANIYPAEVESALDAHPGVLSSIIVGLPDPDLGQRLHAIIQPDPAWSGIVDDEAVLAFLSERIVRYKIPRSFEFVDTPLRDDAGKARRSALRDARVEPVG